MSLSLYQWPKKDNLLLDSYLEYKKTYLPKKDKVRINARSFVKRLRVRSEEIKRRRKKNCLINRRDRKKSSNDRCEQQNDLINIFFLLLK